MTEFTSRTRTNLGKVGSHLAANVNDVRDLSDL